MVRDGYTPQMLQQMKMAVQTMTPAGLARRFSDPGHIETKYVSALADLKTAIVGEGRARRALETIAAQRGVERSQQLGEQRDVEDRAAAAAEADDARRRAAGRGVGPLPGRATDAQILTPAQQAQAEEDRRAREEMARYGPPREAPAPRPKLGPPRTVLAEVRRAGGINTKSIKEFFGSYKEAKEFGLASAFKKGASQDVDQMATALHAEGIIQIPSSKGTSGAWGEFSVRPGQYLIEQLQAKAISLEIEPL